MNRIKMKSEMKIPFTVASKEMKYLGTSLIRKVQVMYTESYRDHCWKELQKIYINGETSVFMD